MICVPTSAWALAAGHAAKVKANASASAGGEERDDSHRRRGRVASASRGGKDDGHGRSERVASVVSVARRVLCPGKRGTLATASGDVYACKRPREPRRPGLVAVGGD